MNLQVDIGYRDFKFINVTGYLIIWILPTEVLSGLKGPWSPIY